MIDVDLFKTDSTRSLLARIYVYRSLTSMYIKTIHDYIDCSYRLFQTSLLSMAINVNRDMGLAQQRLKLMVSNDLKTHKKSK